MPFLRSLRPAVVLGLVIGSVAICSSAADAVPRIVRINESDRFVDVDSSNDGLISYAVAARVDNLGTRLYTAKVKKSSDGGASWTDLNASPVGLWTAVSTSSDGQVVAAVGAVSQDQSRLFVSRDGGATFVQKGPVDEKYLDVAVSADGDHIFVTRQTSGISKSSNGGDTWTTSTSPLVVDNIAVSANGDIVVASKYNGTMWRSTDGGGSWIDLRNGELPKFFQDIAMSDDGLTVFAAEYNGQGYIWDISTGPPILYTTGDLGYAYGQSVRVAISPDGNTFMTTSYSMNPKILRDWTNRSEAPAGWTTEPTGTAVLGMSVTDHGTRFIVVNENAGIFIRVPQSLPPVASSLDVSNCDGTSVGSVDGGDLVSINGSFLFDVTSVTFGGVPGTGIVESELGESITVVTPPGSPGTVDVVVTTSLGTTTLPGAFTYTNMGAWRDWTQSGQQLRSFTGLINGENMAMSEDGTTVAVAQSVDGSTPDPSVSVEVRVYRLSDGTWQQRGTVINGMIANFFVGLALDLNDDGSILAIGMSDFFVQTSGVVGSVTVLKWAEGDGSTPADWAPHGSVLVSPNDEFDGFGFSVALNGAGDVVAVGAPFTDGEGDTAGVVYMYGWSNGDWVPRVSNPGPVTDIPNPALVTDIRGDIDGSLFGWSVALDRAGDTLIAGGPALQPDTFGSARVFDLSTDSWMQIGQSFVGDPDRTLLGWSVAIDDSGRVVAIGPRVFDWSSDGWAQRGPDDQGGGLLGSSVDLNSDGSVVAVGISSLYGGSCNSLGVSFVAEWREGIWVGRGEPLQQGLGQYAPGRGVAIDATGAQVAVLGFNQADQNLGAVSVYRYTPAPPVVDPPLPPTPPVTAPPSTPPTTVAPDAIPSIGVVSNLPILNATIPINSQGGLDINGSASTANTPANTPPPIVVRSGQEVNIRINDFQPNENVWIGFYSDPFTVARLRADANGAVTANFKVPSGLSGDHTLVVHGSESGRGIRVLVRVSNPSLPRTGSEPAWPIAVVFLGLGLLFVIASRGRRHVASGRIEP